MAAGRSRQDDVHNAMARRRRLEERTSLAAIVKVEARTSRSSTDEEVY
jgi:hypothetical protein